jgi:hypothetical protein
LISYNITFGPSYLNMIDYRVWRPHKNKITNKQITKRCVCNRLKEGCMLLGSQYGGMTRSSGSTPTKVRMDACS